MLCFYTRFLLTCLNLTYLTLLSYKTLCLSSLKLCMRNIKLNLLILISFKKHFYFNFLTFLRYEGIYLIPSLGTAFYMLLLFYFAYFAIFLVALLSLIFPSLNKFKNWLLKKFFLGSMLMLTIEGFMQVCIVSLISI